MTSGKADTKRERRLEAQMAMTIVEDLPNSRQRCSDNTHEPGAAESDCDRHRDVLCARDAHMPHSFQTASLRCRVPAMLTMSGDCGVRL